MTFLLFVPAWGFSIRLCLSRLGQLAPQEEQSWVHSSLIAVSSLQNSRWSFIVAKIRDLSTGILGPPRPQTPRQGMIPCTLSYGCCLTRKESKFPLLLEKNSLAWRLCASGPAAESGHPGCFASGESREIIPWGKLAFPLGFFRLSKGQKPSNFRKPQRGKRMPFVFPTQ